MQEKKMMKLKKTTITVDLLWLQHEKQYWKGQKFTNELLANVLNPYRQTKVEQLPWFLICYLPCNIKLKAIISYNLLQFSHIVFSSCLLSTSGDHLMVIPQKAQAKQNKTNSGESILKWSKSTRIFYFCFLLTTGCAIHPEGMLIV